MNRILPSILVLATGLLLWPWQSSAAADPALRVPAHQGARPAPDFPTQDPASWTNSPPLSMSDLRGRVVLVDVWTYG